VFHIFRAASHTRAEDSLNEIADMIQKLGPVVVAADEANGGASTSRQLRVELQRRAPNATYIEKFYDLVYGAGNSKPQRTPYESFRYVVSRTAAIGRIVGLVKSRKIRFPKLSACCNALEDLWSIRAEPDDNNRRIKYTKEPGKTDDLVHALAYAQEVAVLAAQGAIRYGIM